MARTSEITRAVVEVKAPEDVELTVDLPSEEEEGSSKRQKLTESAFFDHLSENTSPDVAEEVRELVDEITDLGPERVWRSSSVSLRLPDPGGLDRYWTVIGLEKGGTFELGYLNKMSEEGDYDSDVWESYLAEVTSLTGATAKRGGTEPESIQSLLQKREEYVEVVRRFVERIRAASEARNE